MRNPTPSDMVIGPRRMREIAAYLVGSWWRRLRWQNQMNSINLLVGAAICERLESVIATRERK